LGGRKCNRHFASPGTGKNAFDIIALTKAQADSLHQANEKTALKKQVGHAAIFLLVTLVLSIYIITQINLPLFFGDIAKLAPKVYKLSVLWNELNIIRTVLLAFAVYHLFNAYSVFKVSHP